MSSPSHSGTHGNTFGHPKGACPRGVAECTGCNPNSGPAAEADPSSLGLTESAEYDHLFVGPSRGYARTTLLAVSTYLAINPPFGGEQPPAKQHVANALSFTGVAPDARIIDAVHSRLFTDTFTDEDGEHDAQAWSALDADDRFPGRFVTLTATRGEARMGVDEGDASSYSNPGFSWRVEIGPHFYSGQAETCQQAQREAVSTADYVASGQAEADYWADLDAEREEQRTEG